MSCGDLQAPPGGLLSTGTRGRLRLESRPRLALQLLGNLLDPPQSLLRLQLLQAEQGQAQLVLLGVRRRGVQLAHIPPQGSVVTGGATQGPRTGS